MLISLWDVVRADEPEDDILVPNIWRPTVNYRGVTGLIDMPTARFQRDGDIVLAGSSKQPDQRVSFLFQATPWLQGAFRYTHINGFLTDQPNFFDRSFALKLRLKKEGRYLPAIAVGAGDLLGTGVYGGEYIVGSKRFGNVDTSFGLGFGRLGSSQTLNNPLIQLSDSFATRTVVSSIEETGRFSFGSYFSGADVGLFGGIEYTPPLRALEGLKLQLEYSSDRYLAEAEAPLVQFNVRAPVNFGVTYQPTDYLEMGGHYLYGSTFGFRLALKTNPKKRLKIFKTGPRPENFRVRDDQARQPSSRPPVTPEAFELQRHDFLAADQPTVTAGAATLQPWHGPGSQDPSVHPVSLRVSRQYLAKDFQLAASQALCLKRATRDQLAACTARRAGEAKARRLAMAAEPSTEPTQGKVLETVLTASGRAIDEGARPLPTMPANELYQKITDEAARIYLQVQAIKRDGRTLAVTFRNRRYDRSAEALGRMTRILTRLAPDDVEIFDLILASGFLPVTRASLPRGELERILKAGGGSDEILATADFEPAPVRRAAVDWRPPGLHPSLDYSIRPGFRQSLFDPDGPIRYQFFLRLGLVVGLGRGFSLNSAVAIDLVNNFDEITRESDSQLPRVRSDFAEFLQQGATGIDRLTLDYTFKLAPTVFARTSIGYLEEMFGGAGGEILYKPVDAPWALGLNFYAARQRAFDKRFGFQDLDALTGHASVYWQTPFHDLNLAVHAGRYLAGDYGATFEIKRRFDTGVEVGAFSTFTNVPFEEFGEGSFDKGLLIKIPFGWFSPYPTRESYGIDLRPLTRDGGQRLNGSTVLFDAILEDTRQELERNFDGFLD